MAGTREVPRPAMSSTGRISAVQPVALTRNSLKSSAVRVERPADPGRSLTPSPVRALPLPLPLPSPSGSVLNAKSSWPESNAQLHVLAFDHHPRRHCLLPTTNRALQHISDTYECTCFYRDHRYPLLATGNDETTNWPAAGTLHSPPTTYLPPPSRTMSRHSPPSRAPSRSSLARSFISRRLSFESDDENVFSDDHARDFPLTGTQFPRGGFPPPRQQYFDNPFTDPANGEHASNNVPLPEIQQPEPERNSTAKTRLMIDDLPSASGRGLARASSTSSRLTVPRSQSPYSGPSAPSHPYGMYPQMTRNPSNASQSTFRSIPDSSFLAHTRPEHPYHMYPQNTVEAEDEDITANGIPLGFPRGNQFQASSGGSSGEVGDIIGTDGHIEQLPPYTRYADNTVAKGNMDDLNRRRLSRASRISQVPTQVSEAATAPNPLSESSSAALLPTARGEFEHDREEEIAKKEGWKHRATKKAIGGLPVWVVILICLSVIFSAIVGGVVGGVIGNQQGAERAYANG